MRGLVGVTEIGNKSENEMIYEKRVCCHTTAMVTRKTNDTMYDNYREANPRLQLLWRRRRRVVDADPVRPGARSTLETTDNGRT